MTRSIRYLVLMILTGLLTACGNSDSAATTDDALPQLPTEASVVAMYNRYINGDYSGYVSQMESLDGKPQSYRQQMADLMKQRHRSQEEANGGPKSCSIVRLEPNADHTYLSAFIEVAYKNNSAETIVVPMVYDGKTWRLK